MTKNPTPLEPPHEFLPTRHGKHHALDPISAPPPRPSTFPQIDVQACPAITKVRGVQNGLVWLGIITVARSKMVCWL